MSEALWRTSSLSDLVEDAIGGLWGSAPGSGKPDEADVLVVRGADFRDWSKRRALDAAPRRVPIRSLARRVLKQGDLVLEVSGGSSAQPVGRVVVIDELAVSQVSIPLICSNFCRKLRLKSGVDPFFVKRQLDWLYQSGHTDRFQTSTTNIRNLQVADFLAGTQIMLPGKDVQAQLTAILDATEDKRASSTSHLVTARLAIERFRQSVLTAACSGRLTSAINSREPAWVESTVEKVCEVIADCPHSTPKWSARGIVCLRTTNFTTRGLDLSVVRFVDEGTYRERTRRVEPLPGDVVYSREGGILGIACIIPSGIKACLGQRMMLMRPDPSRVMPRYLEILLNSPMTLARVADMTGGTASPHLNVGEIKRFRVPLPSLEEQESIVARADSLFSLADKVEKGMVSGATSLEKLKQSVLSRAFHGELISAEVSTR